MQPSSQQNPHFQQYPSQQPFYQHSPQLSPYPCQPYHTSAPIVQYAAVPHQGPQTYPVPPHSSQAPNVTASFGAQNFTQQPIHNNAIHLQPVMPNNMSPLSLPSPSPTMLNHFPPSSYVTPPVTNPSTPQFHGVPQQQQVSPACLAPQSRYPAPHYWKNSPTEIQPTPPSLCSSLAQKSCDGLLPSVGLRPMKNQDVPSIPSTAEAISQALPKKASEAVNNFVPNVNDIKFKSSEDVRSPDSAHPDLSNDNSKNTISAGNAPDTSKKTVKNTNTTAAAPEKTAKPDVCKQSKREEPAKKQAPPPRAKPPLQPGLFSPPAVPILVPDGYQVSEDGFIVSPELAKKKPLLLRSSCQEQTDAKGSELQPPPLQIPTVPVQVPQCREFVTQNAEQGPGSSGDSLQNMQQRTVSPIVPPSMPLAAITTQAQIPVLQQAQISNTSNPPLVSCPTPGVLPAPQTVQPSPHIQVAQSPANYMQPTLVPQPVVYPLSYSPHISMNQETSVTSSVQSIPSSSGASPSEGGPNLDSQRTSTIPSPAIPTTLQSSALKLRQDEAQESKPVSEVQSNSDYALTRRSSASVDPLKHAPTPEHAAASIANLVENSVGRSSKPTTTEVRQQADKVSIPVEVSPKSDKDGADTPGSPLTTISSTTTATQEQSELSVQSLAQNPQFVPDSAPRTETLQPSKPSSSTTERTSTSMASDSAETCHESDNNLKEPSLLQIPEVEVLSLVQLEQPQTTVQESSIYNGTPLTVPSTSTAESSLQPASLQIPQIEVVYPPNVAAPEPVEIPSQLEERKDTKQAVLQMKIPTVPVVPELRRSGWGSASRSKTVLGLNAPRVRRPKLRNRRAPSVELEDVDTLSPSTTMDTASTDSLVSSSQLPLVEPYREGEMFESHPVFRHSPHFYGPVGSLRHTFGNIDPLPAEIIHTSAEAGRRLIQLKHKVNEMQGKREVYKGKQAIAAAGSAFAIAGLGVSTAGIGLVAAAPGSAFMTIKGTMGVLLTGSGVAMDGLTTRVLKKEIIECLNQINRLREKFGNSEDKEWMQNESVIRIKPVVFKGGVDRNALKGDL